MAENDRKNDPPFSLRFWQLEMVQARVVDVTIRAIEASKISSNVGKNAEFDRGIHCGKKVAVTGRGPVVMSVEKFSERC